MKKYIYPALLSNAASLGVHWIYDYKFLEELSQKQSLLFLSQEKLLYDQANPSFYVYPNSNVGDLSLQGSIMKWLYHAQSHHSNFSKEDYKKLLVNKFIPGGSYRGYVETYAKKLIVSELSTQLNLANPNLSLNDDHLVGFIPYLVSKELDLSTNDAWSLAQLFTNHSFYLSYYKMFDAIINHLKVNSLKESIHKSIKHAPSEMHTTLEKAIEIKHTNTFIDTYAGRACSIKDAIPVIIHILYHTNSFEEALSLNAMIGGASSDRGLLIGAILGQVYELPISWVNKIPLSTFNK